MVKAVVMKAPLSPLSLSDFPEPELETGAILLRTIMSEVCGTDVHLYHGRLPGVPYPIIPGHVNVGEVEKISGDIREVNGNTIAVGDIITFLDVNETCNNCWYCLVARASTKCPNRKVYGITYSAKDPPHLLGGWAEKIYLKPGVKIMKIPDDMTPLVFMAGGCGLPTAIHAIDRAEIRLGDTVAIQGCGPVGLWASTLAKLSGAFKLVAIGSPVLRLDMAKRLGADLTIDINDDCPTERISKVKDFTGGRGADVTIEATGSPDAVLEGFQMTRDAGRYVIVGQYTDVGSVEINPHSHINKKHLEIRGVWGSDFSHIYRAVEFLSIYQKRLPLGEFITESRSLEDAKKALEDVEMLRVIKTVITP